jgi:hypothetical protein
MGFNIYVSTIQNEDELEENDFFIDRLFYFFICSFEVYGDESILIKIGKYYDVDLIPLTKLVYFDEDNIDVIRKYSQKTELLLDVVMKLYEAIKKDSSVCEKLNYQKTDNYFYNSVGNYIQHGGILKDLEILIKWIRYYENQNIFEIYLSAI